MDKKKIQKDTPLTRAPDLVNAEVALKRAATKAREIAKKSGTSVVYSIKGKIIKESPSEDFVQKENTHRH